MKRRIVLIVLFLFFAFGLVSCSDQDRSINDSSGEQNEAPYVTKVSDDEAPTTSKVEDTDNPNDVVDSNADPLDMAIRTAIAEQNNGKYLPGECYGVGYKIVETFTDDDILSVYALTAYLEYRFEDDVFVSISGTNPQVLMRFRLAGEDNYELMYYERLDIFSGLSDEELEELLQPLVDTGKDYIYTEQDLQEVRAQADGCAAEYLKSIGREADIGTCQEHSGQLLTELALNEDLLKELFKDEELSLYPNWTGTTERIEDGVRYIYQTAFDEEKQEIVYTKSEYETKVVKNSIVVDIQTETIVR